VGRWHDWRIRARHDCPKFAARLRQLGEEADQLEWEGVRLRVTDITQAAIHQARQKLRDTAQKNERASAALIETLVTTKAMIDEINKRMPDTEAADLLAKLLTAEEVENVRQTATDYAKRLVADFNAARGEMHARFVDAITADETFGGCK
jgi:hypothetical protein